MEIHETGCAIDLRSQSFNDTLEADAPVYFGYIYVDDTRAGFDEKNGLWATRPGGFWPQPTHDQYERCRAALAYQPWGSRIPTVQEWIDKHSGDRDA